MVLWFIGAKIIKRIIKKSPEWIKKASTPKTGKDNIEKVQLDKDTILELIDEGLGITDTIQAAQDAFDEGNNFWNQGNTTFAAYENLATLEKRIYDLKEQIKRTKKLIPQATVDRTKKQLQKLLASDQATLNIYTEKSLPKLQKKFNDEMSNLVSQGATTVKAFDDLRRELM